ncbi:MAG: ZIP family metal transporter [Burkholderiales bacterium]
MSTFAWITLASIAGGVLSVALAAVIALAARASWIPSLVSFAIGALLGAAFLEILPSAFEGAKDFHSLAATVLAGILGFFVLEKLVLWRHCHIEDCEAHDPHAHGHVHGNAHADGRTNGRTNGQTSGQATSHDHDGGRSGLLIVVGDSFHNFVDGILIAAAFMQSTQLGIVTAAAVIAHEIPQEMGDFVILLHSGYSKLRALMMNLISGLAMIAGSMLGYFALQSMQEWITTMLAIAAASMIYVAVADLIPGLHKRPEIKATIHQVVLIGMGVAAIWLVGELTHGT